MRFPSKLLAAALLALPWATGAAVEVQYLQPDKYTDAGQRPPGRAPSEPLKRELTAELQRLGQQYLEPGRDLSIDVLDLDLAGRFQWWDARACHPFPRRCDGDRFGAGLSPVTRGVLNVHKRGGTTPCAKTVPPSGCPQIFRHAVLVVGHLEPPSSLLPSCLAENLGASQRWGNGWQALAAARSA
ncbi:DUF3016 domain-containing protein [Solimonas sp. SE-A11]|uniref:DUF3016 domain-containing protein n=1 Tax=Solimonas sp. SE-A11 TaxID=3054954 RepID=UPI00346104D7